MYKMRESWTDERLDDFRDEVNRRFDEVDRRFDRVDTEIRSLKADVRSEMAGVNARFDSLNSRFDSLQRTMLQIAGGTIGTLIAGIVAIVVTQL